MIPLARTLNLKKLDWNQLNSISAIVSDIAKGKRKRPCIKTTIKNRNVDGH